MGAAGAGMPPNLNCEDQWTYDMTNNTELFNSMIHTNGTRILITIVLPCILAVGVLSNGAFLFVLYRVRWMRTITNFYLANLSVADFAFLIAAGGEHLWGYMYSPVPMDDMHLGMFGCIAMTLMLYISYFGSVLLVTLVTLHRFFAICCPNRQELIGSRSRTIKLVTGTWAISILIAVLLVPSMSLFVTHCLVWPEDLQDNSHYPNVMGSCYPVTSWVATVATLAQTIPFFVAVIGNSIMYAKIIQSLTSRVEARKQRKYASPTSVERARDKVARMLIANGIIFFVCLAPFQAMGFTSVITNHLVQDAPRLLTEGQYDTFVWFARMLGYTNSAINPIVYNATNPRYRQAFCEAFPCIPNKKENESPPQSQMTRNFRSTNNTQHYTTCVSKL
ncbi:thyrotropin-releasing hormone receptor-like [Amphiura filiformis]|uniref:thyrotropin-releasing hormone receptor-like n=1 Tax=Amphiura filiformis TaxID=82378 RepID=UPI003B218647